MEAVWRNVNEVRLEIQGLMDDVAKEGAEMIAADARAKVKVKTGTLKRQIEVKTSKFKDGGYIVIAQGPKNYDKFYASFVEAGTHNMPAQPYMRPAVKKNRPLIQRKWQEQFDE